MSKATERLQRILGQQALSTLSTEERHKLWMIEHKRDVEDIADEIYAYEHLEYNKLELDSKLFAGVDPAINAEIEKVESVANTDVWFVTWRALTRTLNVKFEHWDTNNCAYPLDHYLS